MGEATLGAGDLPRTMTGEDERRTTVGEADNGGGGLSIRSCTALRAAKKSDWQGGDGERWRTCEGEGDWTTSGEGDWTIGEGGWRGGDGDWTAMGECEGADGGLSIKSRAAFRAAKKAD